jgi:hypothetical protein
MQQYPIFLTHNQIIILIIQHPNLTTFCIHKQTNQPSFVTIVIPIIQQIM